MAIKIILKKTSTAAKVPLPADLDIGEIAVNLADQKLYSKNASGTIVLVGQGSSGAGTVTSVGGTSPVTSSGGVAPVISLASGYGDTQNPYASKTANFMLAAPNGVAGAPSFRAMVVADVPTLNQSTTGSAATLSTGRTIAITGDLSYTSTSFDGSANVTASGTLATVNANVGSFTNASITVNGKGLITAASSGTTAVTSVTGTSPVVSSGGTTPAISMPAATTLVAGYLTAADWTTFNGKQAAGSYVTVGGALGTPSSGTLTNCTFPTLNQNTTGSSGSCTGNAATVTNGFYTTSSFNLGTTSIAVNRASAAQSLTGINIDGSSASCTGNAATATTASACSGNSATATSATTATTATNATNVAITNDAATTTSQYVTFTSATSGNAGVKTHSTGLLFVPSTGAFTASGNVTAFSDERIKTNWRNLPENFVEQLAQVKSGVFDRTDVQVTQVGVSAQSLQSILEHAVIADENGQLSVAYGNAALVAVIALAKKVLELEQMIKEKQ